VGDAKPKSKLIAFEDFPVLPAMSWRVEGLVPLSGVTMFYGHPKAGKSFTVHSQMLACAAGVPWCGFETRFGKGLYLVSEGFYGILRRHAAWMKLHDELHGITEPLPIRYWRGAVNFLDLEGSVKPFMAELARSNWHPENLAIDTVAKAMPGANDGETAAASLFCTNVRWLESELGDNATIELVHHSTKYDDIFRGAGALDADLDGMILVKKPEEKAGSSKDKTSEEKKADSDRILDTKSADLGKPRAFEISCVHFRDADPFEPFRVSLKLVEVMTEEGPQTVPAVHDRVGKPTAEPQSKTKKDWDHATMAGVLFHAFGNNAASTKWQERMEEKFGWSRSKFMRNLNQMKADSMVTGGGGQGEFYQVVPEALGRLGLGVGGLVSGNWCHLKPVSWSPPSRGVTPVTPVL
jgi:AAA domain